MYAYLFEAKSIQSYLFQSGKLRDVIGASERLDRLIDSDSSSVLSQVLDTLQRPHDLLAETHEHDAIHFMRCKGGAFYSYSQSKESLEQLRSLWTLTISQLFPSLSYTDALCEGDSLANVMDNAHETLAISRNNPSIAFPNAPAIGEHYPRSGEQSVPSSSYALKGGATMNDEQLDLDTEHHRQAYALFDMRGEAALQDKYTPLAHKGTLNYPLHFESDCEKGGTLFPFDLGHNDYEPQHNDMALIHIDGNGLGLLLIALKKALENKSDTEYCTAFRQFSESLNRATEIAAQHATEALYQDAKMANSDIMPMRPIVLGGDDVTLFCHARFALQYAQLFCQAFKETSKKELASIYKSYLSNSDLEPYLTASGGILYHKSHHPFMHCHHLVEALCAKAKVLTKSVNGQDSSKVGPAALAMYRLSNATHSSIDDLIDHTKTYTLPINGQHSTLQLAHSSFFVEEQHNQITLSQTISNLIQFVGFCEQKHSPINMAKWRQIVSHISLNDMDEANRMYHRALDLCDNPNAKQQLIQHLDAFKPSDANLVDGMWYWDNGTQFSSIIEDALLVHHFLPKENEQTHQKESV
ncbi:hypothetical protein N9R79_06570 [Vibrio sp.]|nr:hypothetical protein [Vibrio sp.]